MTADKLHDSITLLPSDLIAETGRQRSAPRPVLRWQRYAAMAACFVLMVYGSVWCLYNLGSGGAKETAAMQAQISMDAAEAVPMEEAIPEKPPAQSTEHQADSAQGTNSSACYAAAPLAVTFYIEGNPYELTKEERSTVARLLLELDYRKDLVCECIAEITIVIGEMEYGLNLEEGFVRGAQGQAKLTDEHLETLQQIMTRLTE